jgi:hypothetical protein
LRQDPLNARPRLIRSELAALRRLASERRVASTRLPVLIRTGPTAPPTKRKEAR